MAVDFTGQTVVCIASGPSLTLHDVELVRQSGLPAVAVNRTITLVPFAWIWYFGDDRFADCYFEDSKVSAEIWTCAPRAAQKYNLNLHKIRGPYNSGLRACQLAIELGASELILLGYDAQHTGGRAHWHANYQHGMGNALSFVKWPGQFAIFAKQIGGSVSIINASRATALTCFPCVRLETALGIQAHSEAIG